MKQNKKPPVMLAHHKGHVAIHHKDIFNLSHMELFFNREGSATECRRLR